MWTGGHDGGRCYRSLVEHFPEGYFCGHPGVRSDIVAADIDGDEDRIEKGVVGIDRTLPIHIVVMSPAVDGVDRHRFRRTCYRDRGRQYRQQNKRSLREVIEHDRLPFDTHELRVAPSGVQPSSAYSLFRFEFSTSTVTTTDCLLTVGFPRALRSSAAIDLTRPIGDPRVLRRRSVVDQVAGQHTVARQQTSAFAHKTAPCMRFRRKQAPPSTALILSYGSISGERNAKNRRKFRAID
ncbi:hypothetical protein NRB56_64010 [Nocardia sp. RB56]|uniref:Uncharacterized protein n=1 Tax=Nocardia aurantia TaxID=2585199 RepID=A0A7K0DZ47_9NOCA|nr:hypothetical protein [Nocardia aurantia]